MMNLLEVPIIIEFYAGITSETSLFAGVGIKPVFFMSGSYEWVFLDGGYSWLDSGGELYANSFFSGITVEGGAKHKVGEGSIIAGVAGTYYMGVNELFERATTIELFAGYMF